MKYPLESFSPVLTCVRYISSKKNNACIYYFIPSQPFFSRLHYVTWIQAYSVAVTPGVQIWREKLVYFFRRNVKLWMRIEKQLTKYISTWSNILCKGFITCVITYVRYISSKKKKKKSHRIFAPYLNIWNNAVCLYPGYVIKTKGNELRDYNIWLLFTFSFFSFFLFWGWNAN